MSQDLRDRWRDMPITELWREAAAIAARLYRTRPVPMVDESRPLKALAASHMKYPAPNITPS